jgi:hypothetical protein
METFQSLTQELRRIAMVACFGILLPIPMLAHAALSGGSDIATLYLALGAGWIAAEGFRTPPENARALRARFLALALFLAIDWIVFVAFGAAAGVESNIPLWLLASLGLTGAFGMVPWFTLKTGQPYCALILAAITAGFIKLGGCVVARMVYGPNALADGYMAADWHTAKVMISTMWAGIIFASALGVWTSLRAANRPGSAQAS